MTRRQFLGSGTGLLAFTAVADSPASAPVAGDKLVVEVRGDFGGAKMYCFGTRCDAIGLSTVFVSRTGRVAVVDGGCCYGPADGDFLFRRLKEFGGHVDRWYLTHAHSDHYGALLTILRRPDFKDLRIDELVFTFPPTEWILKVEPDNRVAEFYDALERRKDDLKVRRHVKGEIWRPDDSLSLETLNDLYTADNLINGNSMCMTATMGEHRIFVTGDLTVRQGRWLMQQLGSERIKHDICFLSHHGQNGADKEFYAAVAPDTVIWPTPAWLWDNLWPKSFGGNRPSGIGTGPWNTNYTKCWLQELKIMKQHLLCRGDVVFG